MTLTDKINRNARKIPNWVIYVLGVVPLGLLVYQTFFGGLGVDPVKAIEHQLGKIGLQLLVASLVITPLSRYARINLIKFRRAIGQLAFVYILLHLLTWLALDIQFLWGEIFKDLTKRPYIIIGMIGFLVMIPLALTSTDKMIRRLGAERWRKLHKLAYVAAVAGVAHYMMLVKAWPLEPILYCVGVAALLFMRLEWRLRKRRPARA